MVKLWFTADQHFSHPNILRYCKRQYKNVNDMNYDLIRRWNTKVGKGDIVFFLGDFCYKIGEIETKNILNQLNGKIIPIRGNHDNSNSLESNIESISLYHKGKWLLLVHRPEDYPFYSHIPNYDLILCGHVHGAWKFKKFYSIYLVNVGVDVWDGIPVTLEEILKSKYDFEKEWQKKWKRKYGKKKFLSTCS